MPALNQSISNRILEQLKKLAPQTKPLWGTMTPAQMIGHLNTGVKYTMGEGSEMPFKGNWKTRYIFKHILLHGIKEIPHNIKLPKAKSGKDVTKSEATTDELTATLEKYLSELDGGDLPTRTHPFFGPLTAKEWQKFHHAHFMHHMKQFDSWI